MDRGTEDQRFVLEFQASRVSVRYSYDRRSGELCLYKSSLLLAPRRAFGHELRRTRGPNGTDHPPVASLQATFERSISGRWRFLPFLQNPCFGLKYCNRVEGEVVNMTWTLTILAAFTLPLHSCPCAHTIACCF